MKLKRHLFSILVYSLAMGSGLLLSLLPDFIGGIILGFVGGYLFCFRNNLSKEITCQPDKNIHIFDEGKEFCQCLGTSLKGEKFSIPIMAQK